MINMNKNEIIEKLKKSNLDKNEIIVISGASLVVHDIINDTEDIDLICTKEYYDMINWKIKNGFFSIDIKYYDVFEISNNLYDEYKNYYDLIDDYKFMNLNSCLDLKRKMNREKDKNVIKILEKKLK